MEANKAPEKIYLFENPITETLDDRWLSKRSEYTRTDSFIEKICEFIVGNMKCSGYTTQTKAKFIKEFRNYMKGE